MRYRLRDELLVADRWVDVYGDDGKLMRARMPDLVLPAGTEGEAVAGGVAMGLAGIADGVPVVVLAIVNTAKVYGVDVVDRAEIVPVPAMRLAPVVEVCEGVWT